MEQNHASYGTRQRSITEVGDLHRSDHDFWAVNAPSVFVGDAMQVISAEQLEFKASDDATVGIV